MSEITLSHQGSGDNVARDKNISFETYITFVTSTVPEDLRKPVTDILDKITNREFTKARESIDLISGLGNQSHDVKDLLSLLNIKCSICEDEKSSIAIGSLQTIISSSGNAMIKDLAISLVLKSEASLFGKEVAVKRYDNITVSGPFSRAVAFELFTSKENLIKIVTTKIYDLTEEELLGLIRGLFNKRCLKESLEASEYLNRVYNNYNSKVVLLFANALSMNESLLHKDYWSLTQEVKNNVKNLIFDAISIYQASEAKDARLFNILIPCLMYVKRDNEQLELICLENIDMLREFDSDFADDLVLKHQKEGLSDNHPVNDVRRSIEDVSYKRKLVDELLEKKEIELGDLWLARNLMTPQEMDRWIKNGVKITGGTTTLSYELNNLFLHLANNDIASIKSCLSIILQVSDADFESVNLEYIRNIIDLLKEKKLSYEACDLLLKFFRGCNDIWCSPFVEATLLLLYHCARYKDFLELESKVNNQDKSVTIANLTIFIHLFHGLPEKAYTSIKQYAHSNNLDFVRLKLLTYKKLEKPDEIINEVSSFDFSMFTPPTPLMNHIMSLLVDLNEMGAFEKIIIDWFIDSPEKNYKYISSACLNMVLNQERAEFTPKYNVNGLIRGVQYKDGNKHITKIISDVDGASSSYLLTRDSLLGHALLDANKGDQLSAGMKNVEVEDIMPPYVAIHRICLSIRDESNDGSDPFQSFSVSDNPEELKEQLKKILSGTRVHSSNMNDLMKQDVAPLAFRMNFVNKHDPVKAAFSLLMNKNVKYRGFVDVGSEVSDSICTDIITVIYLCLISFSGYFVKNDIKLFLIQEDIDSILKWIDEIESDKFMTVAETDSGGLFINTSETIKSVFGVLLSNIKSMISLLCPLNIVPDNYSQEAQALNEPCGPNFAKTMYAIKNSGFPFFSIDTQTCLLYKSLVSVQVVNTNNLLHNIQNDMAYGDKEEGLLLHIHGSLPYPVTLDDFIGLSASLTDAHGTHLSALINKYSGNYNKNIFLDKFMSMLFLSYYFKFELVPTTNLNFLLTHTMPLGRRVDRVFNACCKAICLVESNMEREAKMASFITAFSRSGLLDRNLVTLLSHLVSQFLRGHFLNANQVKSLI
ncbi:hypothetical protein [Pantoea sp. SO10]|uniref:hypothetical protein n=1 Tax=Pantoea sp. SO10 TaxID=2575375 RepID=UPI0010C98D7A|nr:hypothetical protein [Pantoea sp. SO10]QCP62354.1 hypothetical protein FCN45_23380 [Pantoea sp. SO10]